MARVRADKKHQRTRSAEDIFRGVPDPASRRRAIREHRRAEAERVAREREQVRKENEIKRRALAMLRTFAGTHLDQMQMLFKADKKTARQYTGCRSFDEYREGCDNA